MQAHPCEQRMIDGDGVRLRLREWNKGADSTVLLIHGYPDCSDVWLQVADQLARDFHVVTYDVRGAGQSDAPRRTRDYRFEHLLNDLGSVLDAIDADQPVHLVGHDWGSIQGWEAVTEAGLADRFASFTSIAGINLDHAGHWMSRNARRNWRKVAKQAAHSWYILSFELPFLAPFTWRAGLAKRWPQALQRIEGVTSKATESQLKDGLNGIHLYRANVLRRLRQPRERFCDLPVQLIVPTGDHFMSPELLPEIPRWTPQLWRFDVDGTHWLPLAAPQAVSERIRRFVNFIDADALNGDIAPAEYAQARYQPDSDERSNRHLRPPRVAFGLRRKPKGSTSAHDLTPRKVAFDWQDTPKDWIPNEPFASAFINEINLLLPQGEFWFCRLFNQALPLIEDEKLRADVQAFIRQESMHARAHESATREYLRERGADPDAVLARVKWLFDVPLADAPFGRELPRALQHQWLLFRLGIIATVEHMTCVLGNYILDNQRWDELGSDPIMLDLLRWHGAEEVEHRSVAFDVYRELGGGYLSRYYMSMAVVPAIFGLWVDGAATLLANDSRFSDKRPSVFRPWIWRRWQADANRNLLPKPLWIAMKQLSYFTPWYDPVKEGSTEQALTYLAQSSSWQQQQKLAVAAGE